MRGIGPFVSTGSVVGTAHIRAYADTLIRPVVPHRIGIGPYGDRKRLLGRKRGRPSHDDHGNTDQAHAPATTPRSRSNVDSLGHGSGSALNAGHACAASPVAAARADCIESSHAAAPPPRTTPGLPAPNPCPLPCHAVPPDELRDPQSNA